MQAIHRLVKDIWVFTWSKYFIGGRQKNPFWVLFLIYRQYYSEDRRSEIAEVHLCLTSWGSRNMTFSSDKCSSDVFNSRFLPKTFLNCNNGQRNTGERMEGEIQKRMTKTFVKLSWQMRITATQCLYWEQCQSSCWLIGLGQSRISLKKLNRYNDVLLCGMRLIKQMWGS